ncbi:hypothetical protein MLD38_033246 [Melastoma candidum]|uniref:Uncharacterized protein n=1 Tax=Melastoma candidum TaxID=119954 RepID=A0ACB9M6P0_9MYRT|nr:hypothetical protein MLD38_033246 [Melastoma candidum]
MVMSGASSSESVSYSDSSSSSSSSSGSKETSSCRISRFLSLILFISFSFRPVLPPALLLECRHNLCLPYTLMIRSYLILIVDTALGQTPKPGLSFLHSSVRFLHESSRHKKAFSRPRPPSPS